jgi:hypothetical protein
MEEAEIKRVGSSLLEAFKRVPDPRNPSGKRHPLPALLTLATCAMLCNCHSLYAMAQWGREHPELASTLGFKRKQTPCVATLHLVFRRLDREAFEGVLREWAQAQLGDGGEDIAIDGKSLRGIHGEELPGVHLVAAYAQKAGLVLAQKGGGGEGGRVDRRARGAGPDGA